MNLHQLEIFVRIFETKSFSRAAKELYISQPTVSAHIQTLEKEMNTVLFVRNRKDITATVKGEILYGYAKKIVAIEEEIKKEFLIENIKNRRTVNVASSTVPAQFVLPQLLTRFRQEYPHISFSIVETDSAGVIGKVMSMEAEVGITGTKTNTKNAVFEAFCQDQLTLLTPNTQYYRQLLKKAPGLSTLLKEPMLMRECSSGTYMETLHLFEKLGIQWKSLTVAAHMNRPEMILKSVSLGLGITIISRRAASMCLHEEKVLEYPLPEEISYRNLYLVHLENSHLSKSAESFLNYIKSFYHDEISHV